MNIDGIYFFITTLIFFKLSVSFNIEVGNIVLVLKNQLFFCIIINKKVYFQKNYYIESTL